MNNVVKIKPDQDVMEQASGWIARMDRGLSKHEIEQLARWMKQDKAHEEMLLEMAKIWDKMDVLHRLAILFPEKASTAKPAIFGMSLNVAAMAASVFFVGILLAFGWNNSEWNQWKGLFQSSAQQVVFSSQKVSTLVGEQFRKTLDDGSELTLNTDSLVSITYTDKQRLLVLEHGELHIQVAHDEARPLNVLANGKLIQAVGTAFNVQIQNKKVELIVTEGKVLVDEQPKPASELLHQTSVRLPASSLAVSRSQKVVFSQELNRAQTKPQVVAEQDIQANLSWQQGQLIFRGEPLQQVLDEVSRYTATRFKLSDPDIANIKVAGLFKTNDVDGLLLALKENFSIESEFVKSENGTNNTVLLHAVK
ncbi:FecR domain-containing protein [Paraneptunicella aestuarii]|uniref:FecR family protein n=1 Tax=Paraneptunicella aestuarii TaxID=2831148 RepID=UPI001E322652|nr:FecR domain-containing protein [Paraneptunicella aestuarii]UAA40392.1 FecR domain-containing protein [Paraneptunicella aestuarii]